MAATTTRSSTKESHSATANMSSANESKRTRSSTKEAAEPVKPPNTSNAESNSSATSQPLGPPPRPSQQNNNSDQPDYFNQVHHGNVQGYQAEPNPFEAQFTKPGSGDTPGTIGLPPLSSLTSPSSLLPGETPGWNSLRSGPLSPAMLAGPSQSDYFDTSFPRNFPTPNESSLRTGLTPGGGGSMFPAPSPNSQALFNQLQSGTATPGTLDFLRTGISAKAAAAQNGPTSQPPDNQMDLKLPNANGNSGSNTNGNQSSQSANYVHPESDAVNGLFMLASRGNETRNGNEFAVPSNPITQKSSNNQGRGQSPNGEEQKTSVDDVSSDSDADSDSSEEIEPTKRPTRGRGKKTPAKTAGTRRKAEDTPLKTPANKRSRVSIASTDSQGGYDEENGSSNKKVSDEEKRKNFLERNRIAALKCRQRKKQWTIQLQQKVDMYQHENDALIQSVTQLREQLMTLKSVLLAHKDCPVAMQQGFSAQNLMILLQQDPAVAPYNTGQVNGVAQGMPIPVPDGRQAGANQVLPRA